MNNWTGYAQYRDQRILTASPGDLILLLYDGGIRQVRLARLAIQDNKMGDASVALIKAQEIVEELMAGLDFEIDLAHDLFRLYDYLLHRLTQANLEKDDAAAQEAETMLVELRQTWAEVVQISRMPVGVAANLF